MQFDGERLNIDFDLKPDEINELKTFIVSRLDYIEEIGFEDKKNQIPSNAALLGFLVSVKKSKPTIKIEILDKPYFDMGKFGKAHWICNE
jgi:hypothetical protein